MMIEFALCIPVAKNLIYTLTMALEMKTECEKCGGTLTGSDEAYICTYECTFCGTCAKEMNAICPNCGGDLVRRPRAGKINRAIIGES